MLQVICIHGGEVHRSYEAYLRMLVHYAIDPYTTKQRWRNTLSDDLGDAYTVILPEMPNKYNAQYAEWEIWFDKYISFMQEGCVLIGHSLGGLFLARYLATHTLPVTISTVYLVAAPFFTADTDHGGDFIVNDAILSLLNERYTIVLLHSKDDQVVPFSDLTAYSTLLPQARSMIFEDRGHFLQEHFAELVADIKNSHSVQK